MINARHVFADIMIDILGNYENQHLHYFAVIATSLIIRETTKEEKAQIPTAGISARLLDANFEFIYNPDFTDTLNENQLRFLFYHEILHIILATHLRAGLNNHDPMLVNITHDMIINSTILDNYGPTVEAPADPMLQIPKDYKGIRNYESLIQEVQDKSNKAGGIKEYLESIGVKFQEKGKPGEKGEGIGVKVDDKGNPTGETFDVHLDPSKLTVEQQEGLERLQQTVARGLEESGVTEMITNLVPKPSINVIDYISKYTRAMKGDVRKGTWHKLNRKYPGFIKGSKKRSIYFNLILDTSGSMSNKDMINLLGAVMRNNIFFKLIQIDTKIQDTILIKNQHQLARVVKEFKGRGGTILQPALDYCKENEMEEPCVVLTDGYTDTLTFHTRGLIVTTGSECPISPKSAKVTQVKFEEK